MQLFIRWLLDKKYSVLDTSLISLVSYFLFNGELYRAFIMLIVGAVAIFIIDGIFDDSDIYDDLED